MSEYFSHQTAPLDTAGYGVFTVDEVFAGSPVVVASQPNFETLLTTLHSYPVTPNSIVLTPELVTSAGPLDTFLVRDQVERYILEMCSLSATTPDQVFLLGSAYWPEESPKPINAVLVINGGRVSQIVAKTHPTSEETSFFQQGLTGNNQLVTQPDTSILVCRDLYMEGLTPELRGSPSLISPDTRVLLVSSCWGDGSRVTYEMVQRMRSVRMGVNTVESVANASYKLALDIALNGVFEQHPNVEKVILCDRAPTITAEPLPTDCIVASRAFSGVYSRTDRST